MADENRNGRQCDRLFLFRLTKNGGIRPRSRRFFCRRRCACIDFLRRRRPSDLPAPHSIGRRRVTWLLPLHRQTWRPPTVAARVASVAITPGSFACVRASVHRTKLRTAAVVSLFRRLWSFRLLRFHPSSPLLLRFPFPACPWVFPFAVKSSAWFGLSSSSLFCPLIFFSGFGFRVRCESDDRYTYTPATHKELRDSTNGSGTLADFVSVITAPITDNDNGKRFLNVRSRSLVLPIFRFNCFTFCCFNRLEAKQVKILGNPRLKRCPDRPGLDYR